MGILSDGHKRDQQRSTSQSAQQYIISGSKSNGRRRRASNFLRNILGLQQRKQFHYPHPRSSVPVHATLSRTRRNKPNCDPESDRGHQRYRHHKYLYPVALCLTQLAIAPATLAADVGGVSATANPIANSSGSVTNQAIQVLQGPYVTNTYGGGISCQGPTMNFTPYVTHSMSRKDPFESFYYEPQYDGRDFEGRVVEVQKNVKNYPWESWYDDRTYINDDGEEVRWFPDGSDMTITVMEVQPDGVPDNAGSVLWQKPVRTGEKNNNNTNVGFSATFSFPLDGGLQERCKQAADTQISLQQQITANKRLDFEIARLKNCGELMKAGIMFRPGTKYAAICADVMVFNKTAIAPHTHSIPSPSVSESRDSESSAQPASPVPTAAGSSYPVRQQSSSLPSSPQVSPLLTKDQQEVLRAVPRRLPQRQ